MIVVALAAASIQEDLDRVPDGTTLSLTLQGSTTEAFVVRGQRQLTLIGGGGVLGADPAVLGDAPAMIVVEAGSRVELEGMTLAPSGVTGLLVRGEGSSARLQAVLMAPLGGGRGVVVDGGDVEVRTSLFSGGVAVRGPHAELKAGTLDVGDTVFVGGLALGAGGSISAASGTSLVVGPGSRFSDNRADHGGAIGASGASVTVRGGRFEDNVATVSGGAIAMLDEGELTITDSELFGNEAEHGGALHVGEAVTRAQTVTFCRNVGARGGGAVDAGTSPDVRLGNVRFVENDALEGGGVIARVPGLRVEHASFLGNRATVGGAAIAGSDEARPVLRNSLVAWSGQSVAVRETDVDAVVWFENLENLSITEAFPGPEHQIVADPLLVGFGLGLSCDVRADFHRFESPLRLLTLGDWPEVEAPLALCANPSEFAEPHLGAYGGPCGWPSVAWVNGDGDPAPRLLDCNDADPQVHPLAPEIWYNGVDDDCDARDDYDQDEDGQRSAAPEEGGLGPDCNDHRADIGVGVVDDSFTEDLNCDRVIQSIPGTLVLEGRTGCARGADTDADTDGSSALLFLAPLAALRRRRR